MAVAPGTYNISSLQRRADFPLQLQFKDSTGAAIDLTGWTIASQVWDEGRTTKYADWAVAYTNRATGNVELSLTATQTATLPDAAYYDVLLTNPSGLKEYYLSGIIYVSQGYTA
jgi:hypothetical protein